MVHAAAPHPPCDADQPGGVAPPRHPRFVLSTDLGDGPVEALMREDPAEQPWDPEASAEAVRAAGLDLDAIEARDRARTQGEWLIEREELSEDFSDEEQEHAFPRTIGPIASWEPAHPSFSDEDVEQIEADAAFIAAASVDVPALCREVRRLRALQPVAGAVTMGGLETLVGDLEKTRGELARLRGAAAAVVLSWDRPDEYPAFVEAIRVTAKLLPGSLEALAIPTEPRS